LSIVLVIPRQFFFENLIQISVVGLTHNKIESLMLFCHIMINTKLSRVPV